MCIQCRVEKDLATGFYRTSPNRKAFKTYGCRMPCIECSKARYAGGPGRGRKVVVKQPSDPTRRICTRCRTDKGIGEFYKTAEGSQHWRLYGCTMPCKRCMRSRSTRHYHVGGGRERWQQRAVSSEYKAQQAEYMRDYRALPGAREKKRERDAARYAVTRGAPMASLTREQWLAILEVHDHRCAYCLRSEGEDGLDGRPVKLTQDHVIAVTLGGEHTADNVVPACRPCNSRKCNRPVFFMASAA